MGTARSTRACAATFTIGTTGRSRYEPRSLPHGASVWLRRHLQRPRQRQRWMYMTWCERRGLREAIALSGLAMVACLAA